MNVSESYIAAFKVEMERAEAAFEKARQRYCAALMESWPVQEGELIQNKDGKIAKIVQLRIRNGEVIPIACLWFKDGSLGTREITWNQVGWTREDFRKKYEPPQE